MKPYAASISALFILAVLSLPTAPADGSTRYALLVGISDYRWDNGRDFKDLQGSINDLQAIRGILINRYQFLPQNIHLLKDNQATRDGVLTAFKKFLIQPSKPDDIVLFYFSGHGSRVVDMDGDESVSSEEIGVSTGNRTLNDGVTAGSNSGGGCFINTILSR